MEENKNREIDSKKNSRKKTVYRILSIICLCVFFVAVGLMGCNGYKDYQAEKEFEELAEQAQNNSGSESESGDTEELSESGQTDFEALGIEIPEKNIDWEVLWEENEHIYAWLYIPGTDIDYPIVQHPDEASYYLRRDLSGNKSTAGCIFTQFYNEKDFTDLNTVIYGHNMRNGTMFASLHNYENLGFFEEYPYVYIYVPDGVLVYEVFAAYQGGDQHLLFSYDSTTPEAFQRYLDAVFDIRDMGAHFREGLEVKGENHVISLSTCVRGEETSRYLVQAVLLNEEMLDKENLNEQH